MQVQEATVTNSAFPSRLFTVEAGVIWEHLWGGGFCGSCLCALLLYGDARWARMWSSVVSYGRLTNKTPPKGEKLLTTQGLGRVNQIERERERERNLLVVEERGEMDGFSGTKRERDMKRNEKDRTREAGVSL
mmetsp:Transcript_24572/g.50424  ORF Transcript_24572/g.50424 Transcript_24572/m.50424 type:complete len:133 (+) Transcript_24572:438-836(+)